MKVHDFIEGKFENKVVDLAALRAQFPEKRNRESNDKISSVSKLQRDYLESLLKKNPLAVKNAGVTIDALILSKGNTATLSDIGEHMIMEEPLLVAHFPDEQERGSIASDTSRLIVHTLMSYPLVLDLKKSAEHRSLYMTLLKDAYDEKRKSNEKIPHSVIEFVSNIVTAEIMETLSKTNRIRLQAKSASA